MIGSPCGVSLHKTPFLVLTVLYSPILSPFLDLHSGDLTGNEKNTPERGRREVSTAVLVTPGVRKAACRADSPPSELH